MVHFTLIDENLVYPPSSMLGIGIVYTNPNIYVSQLNFTILSEKLMADQDMQVIGPIHNSSKISGFGSPTVLDYVMKTIPKKITKYDFVAGWF